MYKMFLFVCLVSIQTAAQLQHDNVLCMGKQSFL